jgi:hypothetical protein
VAETNSSGELRTLVCAGRGHDGSVNSPHAEIEGKVQGNIVNLADHRAKRSLERQLDLLSSLKPNKIVSEPSAPQSSGLASAVPSQDQLSLPLLFMPRHHDVQKDVNSRRLQGNLAADIPSADLQKLRESWTISGCLLFFAGC